MKYHIKNVTIRVLNCFKKNIDDNSLENIAQFIMFGIIGVSNTLLSYLINVGILLLLRSLLLPWDYIAGNIAAFLLSVLWSFYWNNRLVFTQKEGEHRSLWKALLKAYAAYGFTGIILNNILSWVWITVFQISKYVAPLINLIISVPLNFIINKVWTFKGEK